MARCRRAASAIEFAIIAPIFLVLLFGLIAYGGYMFLVNNLQQLAAEAARASVAGLSDTERSSLAQGYVTSNLGAYPLIASNRLTVTAAAAPSDPNAFLVMLSYDASQSFVFAMPKLFPLPSPTIVRSAAIQRGGY